jgi:hypothetical protein
MFDISTSFTSICMQYLIDASMSISVDLFYGITVNFFKVNIFRKFQISKNFKKFQNVHKISKMSK